MVSKKIANTKKKDGGVIIKSKARARRQGYDYSVIKFASIEELESSVTFAHFIRDGVDFCCVEVPGFRGGPIQIFRKSRHFKHLFRDDKNIKKERFERPLDRRSRAYWGI